MIHVKDCDESSKNKEEKEETHRAVQILAPGELVLQVATTNDLKKTNQGPADPHEKAMHNLTLVIRHERLRLSGHGCSVHHHHHKKILMVCASMVTKNICICFVRTDHALVFIKHDNIVFRRCIWIKLSD
jgi:hypothetical protein